MGDRILKDSALKRLKETFKSEDLVLPAIYRHVMRKNSQDVRPDDHSMEHMHPSDMAKKDWCGRHDYYRIVGTPAEKESKANPSFRMENLFAEGHQIQGKYQDWLWDMGVLFGDWLCLECGHRYGALSPKQCQFCLSPRLQYRELPLRRKLYLIEGHADAAVHNLDGFDGLIEVKSIGVGTLRFDAPRLHQRYVNGETLDNIWWKINRPFTSHLKQGQLYLWLAWPRYERIAFIYESKFNQATKEFVVEYNKNLIAPLLETAREVTSAVKDGTGPPPRPTWAESPDTRICHSCPYRRTCWGIDDGDQEETEGDPTAAVRVRRTTSAKRKRRLLRPA